MADKYLLGVDVGTSGSKGVITDLSGRVLAHHSVEHTTSSPQPGWYEHDADQIWWGDTVRVIRALLDQAGIQPADIAGVGLSALCPDMLPVDADGRPLRPAILYGIDTRTDAEIDWINRQLGTDFIFRKSGNTLSAQSVTPKALWFKRHEPELYARTHKIHGASSYLLYKMTGEHAVDFGIATFYTPVLDIRTHKWDEDVCRAIGIDPDLLPRVDYGVSIAGKVTLRAAAETGLTAGTPVITGSCDASAEVVSVGALTPGDGGLTYGSTICLLVATKEINPHPSFSFFPHVIPDLYILGAGTATSASLTRWFRDNFGHVEMETERLLGLNAYHLLSDEAAQVPAGSEGLVVLPYFAGERTPIWDTQARGCILGLTLSHSRAHVYRALLEGTAYSVRHNLEVMAQTGTEVKRLISTGGGVRSALWTQIMSDVTGRPQEVADVPYGSPYGSAYMAGYGVGLFPDLRSLHQKWVKIARRVEPNPRLKPLYDQYYEVYRQTYEHVKENMHTLARLARSGETECTCTTPA
jgi:xylulokinase